MWVVFLAGNAGLKVIEAKSYKDTKCKLRCACDTMLAFPRVLVFDIEVGSLY